MPGRHITAQQQELYMSARRLDATQEQAAARAGMSERTGRTLETDPSWQPAGQRVPRRHRTRADPFDAVWESEVVPLLEASPGLQATTILHELQARHAGAYPDKLLRTLQRRVREWKALKGSQKEVYFPQVVKPGWQMLCDFTVMDELGIAVAGATFAHRLAHVRLRYSGWAYVEVVHGGESYTALASAVVHALDVFGGVPEMLRTDSLSAAFANRDTAAEDDARRQFAALCDHYALTPTRNNRGKSHENGGIESPNGHLKTKIDQALLLRGSRDFPDHASYAAFVSGIVAQDNARRGDEIARERPHLRPLPTRAHATYSVLSARVNGNSLINVARESYSLPSRLKGHMLTVHLYDARIECFLGTTPVFAAARVRPAPGQRRAYRIDYRHVIASLAKKPGALRGLSYREALHPSAIFRQAWERLDAEHTRDDRVAPRRYVDFLRLAALHDEASVEAWLAAALAAKASLDPRALEAHLNTTMPPDDPPVVTVAERSPAAYDALIGAPAGTEATP